MWIIGILAVIILVGILLRPWGIVSSRRKVVGMICIIFGGLLTFMTLLLLLVNRLGTTNEIVEFRATSQVVMQMRENGDEIERAAIAHKIIEANRWLASVQYWNQMVFDLWIPDEVMQLEPMR